MHKQKQLQAKQKTTHQHKIFVVLYPSDKNAIGISATLLIGIGIFIVVEYFKNNA